MIILRQSTISAHLVQFCRFLRKHSFNVGPEEETVALLALKHIPYHKAIHFKNALRSTLVKNKPQLDEFDALYLQYWSEIQRAENSKEKQANDRLEQPKPQQRPSLELIKNWLYGNREKDTISIASFDRQEGQAGKDFSGISSHDLSTIQKHTRMLIKKLSNSKGRRYISSNAKDIIDLRKIMRKNVGRSDELIHLKFKKRKIEKVKIVLLCDVSRSMEMYTHFLIQFMFSLNQAATSIETFVFSTKLARITKQMEHHDFNTVLSNLKESFDGWSSGTKIGESLWDFALNYAPQVLNQKSKVIILSDGWDTGDKGFVKDAMSKINRIADKIIWLNPLAGNPNFSPETLCLQSALPFVDIFQAFHSTDDLLQLMKRV